GREDLRGDGGHGLGHLLGRQVDDPGPGGGGVAPFHNHRRARLLAGPDLDLLGHQLADDELVLAADVLVEGDGHLVAGDGRRAEREHAARPEGGHLRRPAAHVDDEVGAGPERVDAAADGAADRLGEQLGPADARLLGRFEQRPAFQRRGAGGNADDDREAAALQPGGGDALEDLPQEPPGGLQIGDDPVPQGADDLDAVGRAAHELLGGVADADHVGVAAAVEAEG